MKDIRTAILAVCIGTLGGLALQAQENTFDGSGALANQSGALNSAFGYEALYSNTLGTNNTAVGAQTLQSNTSGFNNTATGALALESNTSGFENTATGYEALNLNTTGYFNTATGFFALQANTSGSFNAATGPSALADNTTGYYNVANGNAALYYNTSGTGNTAMGPFALGSITTGSENVGIGYAAGYYLPAGVSNNIDIGNEGSATDYNATIRIGTLGKQQAFYVAGVFGVATGLSNATEVMIDSNGQLGVKNSSIRFKEDVHDMAAASDGLMRLRPVIYRYKQPYADGSKPIDYGLIAEEVAEVYPDLVARDADGQIQTVQYQKLTPMLLNEVQKEHKLLEQQEKTIELLEKRLAALEAAQPSAKADTQLAEK
ncbi:MAG: tail fiber domain-containing protein [Terracidiphilus sp.]|jgi:hypothetical protein